MKCSFVIHHNPFSPERIHDPIVEDARLRDDTIKQTRQHRINSSKYRKSSQFHEGDIVLIRNFNKSSKYDPYFQYDPLAVTQIDNNGRCLTLMLMSDGKMYKRHPDDVKLYYGSFPPQRLTNSHRNDISEEARTISDLQNQLLTHVHNDDEQDGDNHILMDTYNAPQPPIAQRSARQRFPNPRYFNEDMVNNIN